MTSSKKFYLVLALLVAFITPSAAQIDFRGAGCIGPCNASMCCDQWITLNPSGVGFARDFGCKTFMQQATSQEREYICKQLREKNAVCPEITPFCVNCEDLRKQIDAEKRKLNEAKKRSQEARKRLDQAKEIWRNVNRKLSQSYRNWEEAVKTTLSEIGDEYMPAHEQLQEAADKFNRLSDEWIADCQPPPGTHAEYHCQELKKRMEDATEEMRYFNEKWQETKEYLDKVKEDWEWYEQKILELHEHLLQAIVDTYSAAAKFSEAKESEEAAAAQFKRLGDEYKEQCEEAGG